MTVMMSTTFVVQGFGALAWGWLSDRLVRAGWDEIPLRKGLLCFYQVASAAAILGIGFSTAPSAIFGWLIAGALSAGLAAPTPTPSRRFTRDRKRQEAGSAS